MTDPNPPVKISIAMAAYNGARYIERQLDSFAAQTLLPDEVVITDDGSTDATADIVAAFAKRAPFAVRYERNPERLGFNRNFERAMSLASGDIVFISDQDDVWYPEKIATVAAVMREDDTCLVVVNDQVIADGAGVETARTVLGNVRAMGRPDSWFGPGCCTAYSRRLAPVLFPFPGDVVAYDHWINVISDAVGARRICEAPLQMYRRHGANSSASLFSQVRPGDLGLVRAARRSDSRASIAAKVAELEAVMSRLTDRCAAIVALGHGAQVLPALIALAAERADYAARVKLLARNRLSRLTGIAGLFAAGRYSRFSGMRTALKDAST